MAKQTELRVMLDALTRAARSGNEYVARTAEQSIFSLFANLECALQSTRNIASERLHGIQRMLRTHSEEVKALRTERDKATQERFEPQPRPFDIEAAKRGEPIEWQPLYAEHWEPGEFVGVTSAGGVVVVLAPLNVQIHPIEKLRMKAREPEQLIAYVTAYRASSGTLYFFASASEDVAKDNAKRRADSNNVIAVAAPVKITVNK